jgi:hypothetical protein
LLCAPTAFWILFVVWSRERTQSGSGEGISWIYYLLFRMSLPRTYLHSVWIKHKITLTKWH